MTTELRAFLALDLGSATNSCALVARVGGRWRLLGSAAGPATVPLEPAIDALVAAARAADPALAGEVGLPATDREVADEAILPRLVARTAAPPRLAIVAVTARQLGLAVAAAEASGWRTSGFSADAADHVAITAALLDPAIDAVLVGAGEPAFADERGGLANLVRVVAAVAGRRSDLRVVLAGAAATLGAGFSGHEPTVAPAPSAGPPPGGPLRELLAGLRPAAGDGREAIARAIASLAEVLDRRVEAFEVGFDAGLRCVARPNAPGEPSDRPTAAVVARAALVPPDPDDATLGGIIAWSTAPRDRHRLRDRLHDLRRDPWGGAAGDGALLRMAAARAALGRLLVSTAHLDQPHAPDLVIVSGGVWAVAPGPAVALALADVARRPAVSQYAYDHARLLGPLGMIDDEADRRLMLADLADDLLEPLGTVIVAAGVHPTRSAGRLVVLAGTGSTELDLVPGGLQLVDLPPGQIATAEISFRDPVVIGTRARRFVVEVSGGLGGLLVDLRDVPLRLPERSERRRELLAAWQEALWTGIDG